MEQKLRGPICTKLIEGINGSRKTFLPHKRIVPYRQHQWHSSRATCGTGTRRPETEDTKPPNIQTSGVEPHTASQIVRSTHTPMNGEQQRLRCSSTGAIGTQSYRRHGRKRNQSVQTHRTKSISKRATGLKKGPATTLLSL